MRVNLHFPYPSYHLMDFWVALRNSIAIRSHKGCGGHAVQVVVLWGVSGPLEHVQHAAGDDKSAENVDEGDEGGGGSQALGGVGGVEPASHHQKTTFRKIHINFCRIDRFLLSNVFTL